MIDSTAATLEWYGRMDKKETRDSKAEVRASFFRKLISIKATGRGHVVSFLAVLVAITYLCFLATTTESSVVYGSIAALFCLAAYLSPGVVRRSDTEEQ